MIDRLVQLALMLLTAAPVCMAADGSQQRIDPQQIARCLKLPVASAVAVAATINPYYLRGDFEGDGVPDYAVAVRGKATRRLGLLVCTGRGLGFLLGATTPRSAPFSSMPNDNFFAHNWEVYSRSEAEAIAKYPDSPKPFPAVSGDSIAMIFEDGLALIYWDGARFRWAQ